MGQGGATSEWVVSPHPAQLQTPAFLACLPHSIYFLSFPSFLLPFSDPFIFVKLSFFLSLKN